MLHVIVRTMRLPFLVLTPLCISVAVAYATFLSITLQTIDIVLCFVGALLAHASVNMLNEVQDHLSGLDAQTLKTPFSGGSGILQIFPEYVRSVNSIAWVLFGMSACVVLYFVIQRGIDLVPIGLLGLALVAFYTPNINKLPLICLVAPGFGFGIVVFVGTFIAMTGTVSFELILLAFPIFMLTNNLLLLNQYPDVEADAATGRSHMIIKYGLERGLRAYLYHVIVTVFATMFILLFFQWKTWGGLLLIPSFIGIICYFGLRNYILNKNLSVFTPYLALNVVACLTYPLFLSLLLWFA